MPPIFRFLNYRIEKKKIQKPIAAKKNFSVVRSHPSLQPKEKNTN